MVLEEVPWGCTPTPPHHRDGGHRRVLISPGWGHREPHGSPRKQEPPELQLAAGASLEHSIRQPNTLPKMGQELPGAVQAGWGVRRVSGCFWAGGKREGVSWGQ